MEQEEGSQLHLLPALCLAWGVEPGAVCVLREERAGTGAVECSVPEMWGLSPGWRGMDRRSPGYAGDLLFVALFFNHFLPLLVFIAHIFPVTVRLGFHPF